MTSALLYDRLQFAVTSTFHYLFPQLTMGLALLLVYSGLMQGGRRAAAESGLRHAGHHVADDAQRPQVVGEFRMRRQ